MKDIIEIPVIFSGAETIEKLLNDTAKRYSGFMHYEMEVSKNKSLYVYFLNAEDREEYLHIWDLLIPKAPACIMVEGNDAAGGSITENYKNRYETPLFLIRENQEPQVDTGKTNDQKFDAVVTYDPEHKHILKYVVREAFNHLLSADKEPEA